MQCWRRTAVGAIWIACTVPAITLPLAEPAAAQADVDDPLDEPIRETLDPHDVPLLPSAAPTLSTPPPDVLEVPPAQIEMGPPTELVDARTRHGREFVAPDGTHRMELSVQPQFVDDPVSGEFVEVDPSLATAEGRPGWVRSGPNDWKVSFGPVSEGAVEVLSDLGQLTMTPRGAQGVPVVSADRSSATYHAAWPSVDVRYTVSAGAVKEDLVLLDAAAPSEFLFDLRGATAALSSDGTLRLDGPIGEGFGFAPLFVTDGSGATIEAPVVLEPTEGRDGTVGGALRLALDAEWLAGLPAETFPLTVDPTLVTFNEAVVAVGSGGQRQPGVLAVGRDAGGVVWRTVVDVDYEAQLNATPTQYTVKHANMSFDPPGATEYVPGIQVYEANGSSLATVTFADAVGDGSPDGEDNSHPPCGGCGMLPGTAWITTDTMRAWFDQNLPDRLIGVTGSEVGPSVIFENLYTQVVLARPPIRSTLTSPAPGSVIATLTPSLQATAVPSPDGEPFVVYFYEITTGDEPGTGALVSSGWTTALSWTPPVGSLVDGVTYHGWVYTATYDPTNPGPHAPEDQWVNAARPLEPLPGVEFQVDQRLGAGGPSPMDSVGVVGGVTSVPSEGAPSPGVPGTALNVNMVTGNLSVGVGTHAVGSLGGSIGFGLSYNSKSLAGTGLTAQYFDDALPRGQINATDPLRLTRLDSMVDFVWSSSPGGTVAADYFAVRWSGYLAPPTGTWKINMNVYPNDVAYVYIDDVLVQQTTYPYTDGAPITFNGAPRRVRIELFHTTGSSRAELNLINANPGANPCPLGECTAVPSYLAPVRRGLADGWTLAAGTTGLRWVSVRDLGDAVSALAADGSRREFRRLSRGIYEPPPGLTDLLTVDANGRIQIQSANTLYSYRSDGELESITTSGDDTVDQPASNEYVYDSAGRLIAIRDPLTGRQATLVYKGVGSPTDCVSPGYQDPPAGALCEFRFWDGQVTRLVYDYWARIVRIINPGSRVIDIGYDASNRITEWRDPLAGDAYEDFQNVGAGSQLSSVITYDSAGRVANIRGPAPLPNEPRARSTYSYSPSWTRVRNDGFFPSATGGYSRQVRYDDRQRIVETIDSAGLSTVLEWDNQDRVVATTTPGSFRSTTRYDDDGRPTDQWGPAPSSNWNLPTDPIAPSNPTAVPHIQTGYDEEIDGLAARYWNNPYFAGRAVKHGTGINATAQNLAKSWGASPPAPETTNGDWSMRLTGDITLAGGLHTFRLSTQSRVKVWVDDTLVLENTTDLAAGFTTPITAPFTAQPGTSRHRIRIDLVDTDGEAGIRLTYQPPGVSGFPFVADNVLSPDYGLVTSVVDPDGRTTINEYADPVNGIGPHHGLVTASTVDPAGLALRTTFTYEAPSDTTYLRQTSRTMPAGNTATTSYYEPMQAPIASVCGATSTTPQVGMTRQITGADPDGAGPEAGRVQQFVYDIIGRVAGTRTGTVATITATGWSCTTYDLRGRLATETWPARDGSPARTNTYYYGFASNSLRFAVSDGITTVAANFDVLARPRQYDAASDAVSTTYDQIGRIASITHPGAISDQSFIYETTTGRLYQQNIDGTLVASIVYDDIGRPSFEIYGNGTIRGTTYDDLSRPHDSLAVGPLGTIITAHSITQRSSAGIIQDETIETGAPTFVDANPSGPNYTYDTAGRLTTAHTPGNIATYGYTATTGCAANDAGRNTNRTTVTYSTGGGSGSYCYDHADRLLSAPGAAPGAITYNDRGHTTSYAGQNLIWDAAGRHIGSQSSSTTASYSYDPVDRLRGRTVSGAASEQYQYVYTGAGDSPDALMANGVVVEQYFSLPGGVLYTKRSANSRWSYPDLRGHIVATADVPAHAPASAHTTRTVKQVPFLTTPPRALTTDGTERPNDRKRTPSVCNLSSTWALARIIQPSAASSQSTQSSAAAPTTTPTATATPLTGPTSQEPGGSSTRRPTG